MGQLHSWARLLGGKVVGKNVRCPGPGHSKGDDSLAVMCDDEGYPVVYSFAGDDWKVCDDYARKILGFPIYKPRDGPRRAAAIDPTPNDGKPVLEPLTEDDEAAEIERQINEAALIRAAKPNGSASNCTVFQNADTLEMEIIEWLWLHWLALGKLHLIAGAPEAGKTTIALSLASITSCGGKWPDGKMASPSNVLIWTSEDSLADTIKPRLVRMGADLKRIKFIVAQKMEDGKTRAFCPATDMVSLVESVKTIPGGVQFLIIDPIVAAIGMKSNSHNNAETRNSLQPVVDFAESANCAVLGISHFTKGTSGKDPVERVTGSLAFGALPRIIFAATKNSTEGESPRIFVRSKSNIGPSGGGFGFDIDAAPLFERPDIIATRVAWGDPMEGSAKELLDDAEPRPERESRKRDAELFLRAILQDGKKLQAEIFEDARANLISEITLKRAKKDIGVKSSKLYDKWWWSLS